MAAHSCPKRISQVVAACFITVLAAAIPASSVASLQAENPPSANRPNEQIVAAPPELVPGKPVERVLSGDQAHSYHIAMFSGQYLRVVVDQRGVDVVVVLYGPDGTKLTEVDSPNGINGPESLSWIAERSGAYRLEVRSLEKDAKAGKYEAKIETLRQSLPEDIHRMRAERMESEAQALIVEGTAESLQKAIAKLSDALKEWQTAREPRKAAGVAVLVASFYSSVGEKKKSLDYYGQALPIYRQLGERRSEAIILLSIGRVYDDLGEKQKALEYYNHTLLIMQEVGDRHSEATTLNNIAGLYSSIGEKQKALEYFGQALRLFQQVGDHRSEATILTNIGGVYDDLGEKQKALEYYSRALPVLRQVGDRRSEATTLNNIGVVYSDLGEKQKALGYYNQALPIRREVQDRRGEATTLSNIGLVYSDLGEKQKALDYYSQALEIYRQIGDRRSEATTLNNIGGVYDDLGEKQKALEYYNQALPIRRGVQDRGGVASTLNNIGGVYDDLGEQQKALEYYNHALEIYRQIGSPSGEATTLSNIGGVYIDLGEKQKALEYYNQALPLRRQVQDRYGEAATLNNIGLVYASLGEQQKALEYYNQALVILRQVGSPSGEASTLNNIGVAYNEFGEKQKALEYHNQALALRRQVQDRGGEATSLNNIGLIYSDLGEQQKALNYYNQALPILRQVGDRSGEAITLSNIGGVYIDLGERQKALKYYNQALALQRQVGSPGGEASTLNNIGVVYDDLGEKQKALEYYNHALALRRQVRDRSGEATSLTNIGGVYHDLGEQQKALDYYGRALLIMREVGGRSGEAAILSNIGIVYSHLGNKQKALEYYNQALLIRREVGDLSGQAITLNNIGAVYSNLGNLDEALTHIEQAITIVESLRTQVDAEQLRASYTSSVYDLFEGYIYLLMRLHQRYPSRGFDAAALQASERGRARSLLDLLNESHADIKRGVEPALLAQGRAISQLLDAKAERLTRILSSTHTEAQAAAAKKEVDDLIEQHQQVEAQIRQKSPRYAALTQPQPLTLAEIQKLLDADTLLLEYSLGPKHSYLWAVTQSSYKTYLLPKASDIEDAARKFYQSLQSAGPVRKSGRRKTRAERVYTASAAGQAQGLARKLSQMLLSPAASMLRDKRLVIVPDGALQYLPFAALADPSNKTKWEPLILRHEIVSLPSASALAIQRRELEGRKPAPKTAIVIADPVFSADDSRVKRGEAELAGAGQPGTGKAQADANQNSVEQDEPLYRLALKRAIRDARARTPRGGLPRLPGTRREGEAVVALVGEEQSKLIVDFAATRAAAEGDEMSQYRYVLFATHGLIDSQNPELSALVLSLVDEQGQQQDGYLRTHQIFNLDLPAEVVVLSACETGVGKEVRGEGLVGLTRGFMHAGAKRVVVSLWSVNDDSTAELMTRFYAGMLKEGKRPAEALRAAQIEMFTKRKRWRASYYWAPFVLQGEWR